MNAENDPGGGRFAYLDFEVLIGQGEGFDYPVQVHSPAGEASETMRFPFDEIALQNRMLILQNALLRSGGSRRQVLSREEETVQEVGRELFKTLFTGDILSRYDVSRERAYNQDKGLRLKLTIQAPKMAAIPWEFLFDPRQSEYVCLSGDTPFVRYLPVSQAIRPLNVRLPLQILGMVANPKDTPPLSIDDEKARVEAALKNLEADGLVRLTWVAGETARDLQRAMRSDDWHVFHFIGHGGFDPNLDEGLIALADANGSSHMLRATDLARLITNRALRLVILNSCEGAQGGENDIFSSTASILLRRGIPSVLAMQFAITDRAAIEFSTAFYEALADGLPVDAAVNEARKSVSLYVPNSLEWGVPVLFMRSPDGVLFQVEKRPAPGHAPQEPQPPAQPKPVSAARPAQEVSPPVEAPAPADEALPDELLEYLPSIGIGPAPARRERKAVSSLIGIDFGTRNSSVAVMESGRPVVIPSPEGERLVPSLVAVSRKHELLVGQAARAQGPENTIFSIKRLLGRKYDDPQVQRLIPRLPYKLTRAANGDVCVMLDGKEYSPPEIVALILIHLKTNAEIYLGGTVKEAVLTVPSYFNDLQRKALKDAAAIAGLKALYLLGKATATSLAYGLNRKDDQTIAVYDLGGGTLDVSILNTGDGVFEVRSTNGDTFLGGDDFDHCILDHLADEFKREARIDLRQDPQALLRLTEATAKARIELSSMTQTDISLPYITADASGPKHLVTTLTRSKVEQLTKELVERSLGPVRQALKDAELQPAQIDEVILSGGMSRMPAVQDALRKLFGKPALRSVNPDEAEALGAAIRAGMLGGVVKDTLLLDVMPLTLSLETLGGVSTPLIERNTTIPTRKSQVFSTAEDKQSSVEIHIVQGERPMAADNTSLGKFLLDGIPPAPHGVPQIEVTFDIEAMGTLTVTAMDKATGRSQNVTVRAASGLSQAEVERMRREMEAFAEQDKRKRGPRS